MTIFESIKRAFGFSGEAYIEEDPNDDDVDTPTNGTPYINPFKKEPVTTKVEPARIDYTPEVEGDVDALPDEALQCIIGILNYNLPDYVRDCIDKEAQKKYICQKMGESLKRFTDAIKQQAVNDEHNRSQQSISEANARINELTSSLDEAKTKADELQSKYILLDTQKKTLTERSKDLEAKVAECEAEMEQYELENKSLQNKIKVIQVKSDDIEYFRGENDRLSAEINRMKAQSLQSEGNLKVMQERNEKLEQLKSQLDAAKQQIEASETVKSDLDAANAKLAELETLQSELDAAKLQLEEKQNAIDDITQKYTIGNTFVESLRKELNATRQELDELKSKPVEDTPVVNTAELDDLKDKLRLANEQITSLSEELTEATNNLEVVEKIQEQLENVEEMKKNKDEKIESLTSILRNRDKEIATLTSDVELLKKSLENKQMEYSVKIKEISTNYEKELENKTAQLNKAKKDNFDMTMLDDGTVAEPIEKVIEVKPKPVAAKHEMPVFDDISSAAADATPESVSFDMVEDTAPSYESSMPKISAIDTRNDDWLRPSPPSVAPSTPEPDEESKSVAKEAKDTKSDDTLQMSLF